MGMDCAAPLTRAPSVVMVVLCKLGLCMVELVAGGVGSMLMSKYGS